MARTSTAAIYVAREAFVCTIDGETFHVNAGERVRAGHPLLDKQPGYFEPAEMRVTFDVPAVEQATAAPGERRGLRRSGDDDAA